MNTLSASSHRSGYIFIIFATGLIFQFGTQAFMHIYAIDGYLFQEWSSEALMQTVPLEDLRRNPLETILNIHIQPPGLDILRAVFIQFWPSLEIHLALRKVDLSLYFLWSLIYSISGLIVFRWLTEITNARFAFFATLLYFLHPGLIFYSTFLDTTLITSVLILWLYFLLWKSSKESSFTAFLTTTTILLFFFRSIFQLPFILIIGFSLFLLKMPTRKLAFFLAFSITICGLYTIKQKHQFGIGSTSSFTGINLVRSVNITNYKYPYKIDLELPATTILPDVLTRTHKLDGQINYNHIKYLYLNQKLIGEYKNYLAAFPSQELVRSYTENLRLYFAPSSRYWAHAIVDRLPWRQIYDVVFSTPILPLLLLISLIISIINMLREKSFFRWFAMLLPALYIFTVSVLFEKGENSRFKFFLEPVFYIFIISQLFIVYKHIRFRSIPEWVYRFKGTKSKPT